MLTQPQKFPFLPWLFIILDRALTHPDTESAKSLLTFLGQELPPCGQADWGLPGEGSSHPALFPSVDSQVYLPTKDRSSCQFLNTFINGIILRVFIPVLLPLLSIMFLGAIQMVVGIYSVFACTA